MPQVKLFANLRKIAGTKEDRPAGTSLREVVDELVKNHPALEGHLLEHGELRRHVTITVNGHPTQDLDARVSGEDQIAIFPPIAGG